MAKLMNQNLYRDIVETIRSTIDIDEVKQNIVNFVGKALNADRCFILEYDKTKEKFLKPNKEYLSSKDMRSYIDVDLNENIPHLIAEFKKGKSLILNQEKALLGDEEIDLNDGSFEAEKIAIEEYEVYSALVFPIYHFDIFLGDLIVQYVEKKHEAGDEEINLLKNIANQIAIAIYQSTLYKSLQKQTHRDEILREVTEIIRSNINIDQTKKLIVNTIGKTLNADRCFLTDFDRNIDMFLPIKYEYRSSENILSCKGENVHVVAPNFIKSIKDGKFLLIKNREIFLDSEEQNFSIEQETFERLNVNSGFAVPLFHKNILLSVLSIHYIEKTYEIGDFEINLMKDIANQVAIAIYQTWLYENERKNAEREKLLREITEKIRSSLDIEKTLDFVCEEAAKIFDVQRVTIVHFYDLENFENYSISREYKTNINFKGLDYSEYSTKAAAYWNKHVLEAGGILSFDNIQESDTPDYFKNCYTTMEVKSMIGVSIKSKSEQWGTLVLSEYNKYRHWSNEEKNLLSAIASQVYIAISQAELYEAQELATEKERTSRNREALLREITESIRSSIDIEKTKQSIVATMGKALNADRCFIVEYDKANDVFINVEYEYLSSNDILGFSGINPQVEFPVFANAIKNGKTLLIQNENIFLDSEDQNFYMEKQALEKFNVKSGYAFPLYYKDEPLGLIAVNYVNKGFITDEEINLLHTISSQIAIALHQAKLYNDIQVYAERERISKNIIEILRSSIDKTIIKKLFVKNIGKFFNADRVFFSEYDNNLKIYLPVDKDSEYLSDPNEKSVVGVDWQKFSVKEYYQAIFERREVKIFSFEEFLKNKELEYDIKNFLDETKVKSSYSFPVLYQDRSIGNFCIDFTRKNTRLSDEDINRIRNMCTQAGIALYHAELYKKAQQCNLAKDAFKEEILNKVEAPTQEILDASIILTKNEFERSIEVEYLNKIINSCHHLLELTKNV